MGAATFVYFRSKEYAINTNVERLARAEATSAVHHTTNVVPSFDELELTLHTWQWNLLGRLWKRLTGATLVDRGLEAIWHRLMHHTAIAVVLQVSVEALQRVAE